MSAEAGSACLHVGAPEAVSSHSADAASGMTEGMARAVHRLMFAYIAILGCEAALRWALSKLGADPAIYLKDLLLYSAGGLSIWIGARARTDIRPFAWLVWTFMVLILAAAAGGLALAQVLFGLKVWLSFVVGFLLVDSGAIRALHQPRWWAALWCLLCFGIVLNHFKRMPWAGMSAQIGGATIEVNRDWNTWGIQRASGFSRSSFDGAILLMLLHVYLTSFTRSARLRGCLVLGSTLAIGLTTTKGALGALFCTFPFLIFFSPRAGLMGLVRWPALLLLASFALVGLLAPALSTQFSAPSFTPRSPEAILFASLADRGWTTWPSAFALMDSWQVVFGRGLGAIGAAQNQFEQALFCPADNLFVYLFVTGGLIGAALYLAMPLLALRLSFANAIHRALFLLLVLLYSYGMTASIIDNSPLALACGVALAALLPGANKTTQDAR